MACRSALALCGAALLALVAAPTSALTVYDPGLGSLPSAQGWTTGALGPFDQSVADGAYRLDTTAADATLAGSQYLAPSLLDTVAGFTLDFDLRFVSETHAADGQRAGYSVIVVGVDARQSLEIGFRQDEVFAYTAGFVPGAPAIFATTATTRYSLAVADDRFRLFGNGNALLDGALVDHGARGIPPYTTPGVIFFGDDTTRAQSSSELGVVALTVAAVPEPQIFALMALGLGAVVLRRRPR